MTIEMIGVQRVPGLFGALVPGVAMGLDPANARAFADKLALDFPILDDSDGAIDVQRHGPTREEAASRGATRQ